MTAPLEYAVSARRVSDTESRAVRGKAELMIDTSLAGRADAFNPAELFLASIAACMLKGIERLIPLLHFKLRGVSVKLRGARQDKPPKMVSIDYEIAVDTDEPDHRIELLHENVRKFGTISNTVAEACRLDGRMTRQNGG